MSKVSQHFKREEFRCKCGKCNKTAVDIELLNVLETVRQWFDEPVHINSANRCEKHNEEVGGSPTSKHLDGLAADIRVSDISPEEVYRFLDTEYPDRYGLGLYKTFVHIDVRPEKRRWNLSS